MKNLLIILTLFISDITYANAQEVNITKWVARTVDSLQKNGIDTIEYYHKYCDGCFPPSIGTHDCKTQYGQIENTIIYRQKGKFYSLIFNCDNPSIKQQIVCFNSVSYFLSIIPVLNERDKIINTIGRNHKLPPASPADGAYDEAFIYCHQVNQKAYTYFSYRTIKGWSVNLENRQNKLLKLIKSDLSLKDNE